MTYKFILPTNPRTKTSVTYTVSGDGVIHVCAVYEGGGGLPSLPAFGLELRMKEQYHNVRYFGLGPEENYIDRMEGAYLGVYRYTAAENLSGYLVPQECGNRMGTRWMEVTDDEGKGIRITREEEAFEHSVLPYSACELEAASHREELAVPHNTWVRILAAQMGVGGDDSWGAPVHDQYLIPSDRRLKLQVSISRCRDDF